MTWSQCRKCKWCGLCGNKETLFVVVFNVDHDLASVGSASIAVWWWTVLFVVFSVPIYVPLLNCHIYVSVYSLYSTVRVCLRENTLQVLWYIYIYIYIMYVYYVYIYISLWRYTQVWVQSVYSSYTNKIQIYVLFFPFSVSFSWDLICNICNSIIFKTCAVYSFHNMPIIMQEYFYWIK